MDKKVKLFYKIIPLSGLRCQSLLISGKLIYTMIFDLESAYEAKKYEDLIYTKWMESGVFSPEVNETKESYLISMPPPNATGVLHLGHANMLALQDIMIRRERMKGKSVLWLPGTDHAAIATQSVVERGLQAEGFFNPREEFGREGLLDKIKEFVDESKGRIRNQIKKMGASCDWGREKYTLDEDMNVAVNTLFQRMYDDELIYRGGRLVNWDPKMQTTVADDEMEHVEEKAKFYYFQYGPVVIGTARPETKFADKVIVVHPDDKRYKGIIGKEFELEWIEGKVKAKVIADECIDMELGTGAMTITPAHSAVDFELAQKYDLDSPQIIDFDGKIRADVSDDFAGMPIEEAREKIVERLDEKGLLVKIDENYEHKVAVNYRGKGVIEPQIMKQWFIDVNKKVIDWKGEKRSIKEVLQDTVRSKMIEIVPNRFDKTYFHWIDNLRDWCISRQIWWGHQIPVWYKASDEQKEKLSNFDTESISSLHLDLAGIGAESQFSMESPGPEWVRDPDTLDTWFSSALWTFATLGWPENTDELKHFHPSSVLETGYDILFFWVARMVLASTYALRSDGFSEEDSIPFKTVYLHGMVRDRDGKKMSKSRPETCIDPLDMIEKYGADALRLSLVIGSSPGNDIRLYEEKIAGYRNFVNKIWNASRFALMNVEQDDLSLPFSVDYIETDADRWILTKLQELIKEVEHDMEKYRFSDAGTKIYDFMWRQYCDWYLEISKGNVNPAVLIFVLRSTLKLLHPFVPFVTEKLWELMGEDEMIISSSWPKYNEGLVFNEASENMEIVFKVITKIRSIRSESQVEASKKIQAVIHAGDYLSVLGSQRQGLMRLARLESVTLLDSGDKLAKAKFGVVGGIEIYLPLDGLIDFAKERLRITKELDEKQKFVNVLEKKLSNPAFVDKAPEVVVEKEKNRLIEYKDGVRMLTSQLKDLENMV